MILLNNFLRLNLDNVNKEVNVNFKLKCENNKLILLHFERFITLCKQKLTCY